MLSKISLTLFIAFIFMFAASANADTFVVDRADDGGGTLYETCSPAPNDCQLRGAIFRAIQNGPGHDTINFDIPGAGPHTITFSGSMYVITSSVTINGASQTGYFGMPMIELNGNGAGTAFPIAADTNDVNTVTIVGLAINRFSGSAIFSNCWGTCSINLYGNFIGTDVTGEIDLGNGTGVEILPSENSVINIGGSGIFEGNIISGNSNGGILIPRSPKVDDPNIQPSTVNIVGNKIGTDFDGEIDLGNTGRGIEVTSLFGFWDVPVQLTIGGSTAGARNIVSGNTRGLDLSVPSATVRGNFIGVNAAGNAAIGNGNIGMFINTFNGQNYVIGGTGPNDGNVISGNLSNGVEIFTSHEDEVGTASFLIQGNKIGTNAAGTAAIPNTSSGIFIEGNIPGNTYTPSLVTAVVTIGGLASTAKNVISGNIGSGVLVGSGDVSFYRNNIGTNSDGTATVPNNSYGISIYDASKVTIGGTLLSNGTPVDAGNLISGNGGNQQGGNGIRIWELHTGQTFVRRNKIGTDITGNNALPNLEAGIRVGNVGTVIGADVIADDGNVISGNAGAGIWLSGLQDGAAQTKIFGNKIGTNSVGGAPLPNALNGIYIQDSPNNLIGQGSIGVKSNVISSNGVAEIVGHDTRGT